MYIFCTRHDKYCRCSCWTFNNASQLRVLYSYKKRSVVVPVVVSDGFWRFLQVNASRHHLEGGLRGRRRGRGVRAVAAPPPRASPRDAGRANGHRELRPSFSRHPVQCSEWPALTPAAIALRSTHMWVANIWTPTPTRRVFAARRWAYRRLPAGFLTSPIWSLPIVAYFWKDINYKETSSTVICGIAK